MRGLSQGQPHGAANPPAANRRARTRTDRWRCPPPLRWPCVIAEAKWRPPLRETDPFILPSKKPGPGLLQRERPRWPRSRWRASSVHPLFQSACKTERSITAVVRRPLCTGPFLVFSPKSRFHFTRTRTHLCVN